jgi:hypothetical protein
VSGVVAEKNELPMGTVAESIALGRLIEEEQIAKSNANRSKRNGLVAAIHYAKERGDPPEQINALRAELHGVMMPRSAREVAAAAVGMTETQYQRALAVVIAAERAPDRFSDLLLLLETSITGAHTELRRRRGDTIKTKASRAHAKNPLLRGGLTPKHNDMMDRAVLALEGAVMGLRLVDHAQLDVKRLGPWLAAFTETASYLHKLHRELIKLYGED